MSSKMIKCLNGKSNSKLMKLPKDVHSNDKFVFLVLVAQFSSISCKCTCSIEDSCKTRLDENLTFHPNIQTKKPTLNSYTVNCSG